MFSIDLYGIQSLANFFYLGTMIYNNLNNRALGIQYSNFTTSINIPPPEYLKVPFKTVPN